MRNALWYVGCDPAFVHLTRSIWHWLWSAHRLFVFCNNSTWTQKSQTRRADSLQLEHVEEKALTTTNLRIRVRFRYHVTKLDRESRDAKIHRDKIQLDVVKRYMIHSSTGISLIQSWESTAHEEKTPQKPGAIKRGLREYGVLISYLPDPKIMYSK